ncbi:MAG: hypothetical protein K2X11_05550 [Acetobacteraceae bacterium]|nr:hypothetical protein [Acetobacteraceae bacterium]
MRNALALLLLLPALAGCARLGSRAGSYDLQELATSAPIFGELIRAAATCGVPVSLTAQDRAARIEQAALLAYEQQGGAAMRDQYLRSVQPPAFDPARRGQDRAQWCGTKRLDIERADGFLSGAEGQAMAGRADNARAALSRRG